MSIRSLAPAVALVMAMAAVAQAQGQGAAKPAGAAATRNDNLQAYVELLRTDLRANKSALFAEVMQFSEAEDEKFWPIYRDYEASLEKLNDERLRLVMGYAETFGVITDADADRIVKNALDLEARRHTLLVSYYDKLRKALPAKTAARALQVEHQFLLLLDLQIASALPVPQ